MIKWRFEIVYQPKYLKKASDFLKACDLERGEIGIEEVIKFESKKVLNVNQVKDKIIQAFKESDCLLLHIEGGMIE